MLFIDLVNSVLQKLRQDPITDLSTDTTTEAYKAQIAANRAIARVWNHKPWSFKRRTETLTLTSGTADYPLGKLIGEIYSIRSDSWPYKIVSVPKHLFDKFIPNPTASTSPEMMILSDVMGASLQPTATGLVTAVSSSASDTSQYVLIKGLVTGQEDYEVLLLSGTAAVSSTKSFSAIHSVTKSDVTVGRITIKSDSDTVTNAVFGPNEKTLKFKKATFYPTPASAVIVTFHHCKIPPFLTHKYEDTEIPERWNYVLEQWGFTLALQGKGQDQLAEFTTQQQLAIKLLEEDMAAEEIISIDEPIISLKAGDTGNSDGTMSAPSGTEFIQGY